MELGWWRRSRGAGGDRAPRGSRSSRNRWANSAALTWVACLPFDSDGKQHLALALNTLARAETLVRDETKVCACRLPVDFRFVGSMPAGNI